MFRKISVLLFAAFMIGSLAACGGTASSEESKVTTKSAEAIGTAESSGTTETAESTETKETAESTEIIETAESTETTETAESAEASEMAEYAVANTLAEDEDTLISVYADQFEQMTYTDPETGLSITYNLFLPAGYDASGSYPMVVFIGDSSCTGSDASVSLTQGRGGLVWATEEWQSVSPTIVAVPTYPETILDDHGSYTTTEYVELTKRYIDYMSNEYAVDTNRIYGTGQSMGCMTTLILASEYPDLYAACMFVDGQWDISTLTGLEEQTFVYFAAEDDTNAWNGAQEVMEMFDADSVSYKYAQWDGTWSVDELSEAAQDLFTTEENQYFISWKTGTIEPKSGGMGGFGAPAGMNSSSYHMASFDYAYNCVAVMEWLFRQG